MVFGNDNLDCPDAVGFLTVSAIAQNPTGSGFGPSQLSTTVCNQPQKFETNSSGQESRIVAKAWIFLFVLKKMCYC